MERQYLESLGFAVRDYVLSFTDEYDCRLFASDAAGACAVASNILYEAVKLKSDRAMFYVCDDDDYGGHCWVRIGNVVVDVTATQFYVPEKVLIEPFSKYKCRPFFKGKVYTNLQALNVVNTTWIEYQRPAEYASQTKKFVNEVHFKLNSRYSCSHANPEFVHV